MLVSIETVRTESAYSAEMADLSDAQVTRYIVRAERFIVGATGVSYPGIKDLDKSTTDLLETTALLLVDLLYWRDNDKDYQNIVNKGLQSERLGDYSYSNGSSTSVKSWGTGNDEIDMLLAQLTPSAEPFAVFMTSEKASKRRGGYHGFY